MALRVHAHFIDKLAFANSIVAGFALYPQIWNILHDGASSDFSSLSLVLMTLNGIVWMLYAVHRRITILFISPFLNTVAAVVLLFI